MLVEKQAQPTAVNSQQLWQPVEGEEDDRGSMRQPNQAKLITQAFNLERFDWALRKKNFDYLIENPCSDTSVYGDY
jgi:hypothetical protein